MQTSWQIPQLITSSSVTGDSAWSNTQNASASDDTYSAVVLNPASEGAVVHDSLIYLWLTIEPSGSNMSAGSVWSESDTVDVLGGAGELWGLALTPALVNAPTFGVALAASGSGLGGGLSEYLYACNFGFSIPFSATIFGVQVLIERYYEHFAEAKVDAIKMRLFYSRGSNTTTMDGIGPAGNIGVGTSHY